MSSDSDIHSAIREVLSTKPLSHNMRWELEVQSRRLTQYEKVMRVAKEAYDALNKMVTLSGEEIAAHKKAFREAQNKYELERNCWICAVGHVEDSLNFAKLMDEIAADNYREAEEKDDDVSAFRYLSEAPEGSAEDVRNKALQAAESRFREERDDVHDDCVSFYRGSNARGRSSAIHAGIARASEEYNKKVAEAEEAYYMARLPST